MDKSLELVQYSKESKVKKLKYEKRMNDLKLELSQLENLYKQEQQKITKTFPQICDTNSRITLLKQKKAKFQKLAISLGVSLNGDNYRYKQNELIYQIIHFIFFVFVFVLFSPPQFGSV